MTSEANDTPQVIGRAGAYEKGVARRQEILDRAIEVFRQRGADGTSLRRIAGAIGVSHGALLKTLICHFLCMDLAAIHTFDIANASVSAALYEGGRFKVITLNDMSHLPDAFAHLSQNSAVI